MFKFSIFLIITFFAVFLMGFINLFVKKQEENKCEMTYMYQYPQYVNIDLNFIQKKFPHYNLYAYGEGNYADTLRLKEFNGNPVLFVHGNAGSYQQSRSLASVGLVMSYSKHFSHLNYFSIDFNEDLSAFIGEKLEFQTKFLHYSVKKIIDLYREVKDIQIVIIGHSIGGVLIKALMTKDYFKPYLKHIAVVFTLATPHKYPAILYDWQIFEFYRESNRKFMIHRKNELDHINFLSVGGSYRDTVIRSDLVNIDSGYKFDRTILSTAIDDVWVSSDHIQIVWCRQLVIKLNQILFDLIDKNTLLFIDSPEKRQKIIDYHIENRYFDREFPTFEVSNKSIYLTKNDWIVHKNRLIRLDIQKVLQPINHLIPLVSGETIVVLVKGTHKPDTVGVCQSVLIDDKLICSDKNENLYSKMKLAPSNDKIELRIGHFDSLALSEQGFNHLVVRLTPSTSTYHIMIDRFTTIIRQKSLILPSFGFSFNQEDLFYPKTVFSKLVSQEQIFFNLTLENFHNIWDSYWLSVITKSCYKDSASFVGFAYLSFQDKKMNEYFWPFNPTKGDIYQFKLALNQVVNTTENPSLLIYLEPNCGFEIIAKFSIFDAISQLLRHYHMIIIPISASIVILLLSIQFSNLKFYYTFSNKELATFKDKCIKENNSLDIDYQKCYIFMLPTEIMTSFVYFVYLFLQIVLFSILTLQFLKCFYPDHDLTNLTKFSLFGMISICVLLFLFAYSIIYVFLFLVQISSNNLASIIVFLYIKFNFLNRHCLSQSNIKNVLKKFVFKWNLFVCCISSFVFILGFIFFVKLNYYLVQLMFTLLMLIRTILLTYTEEKIGRTTTTSFMLSIYPVMFFCFLTVAVLQILQTIDLFKQSSFLFSQFSLTTLKQYIFKSYRQDCVQTLVLIIVYFFTYHKSLKMDVRLSRFNVTRVQKFLNVLLILLAFINILVGVLALEHIAYCVIATLAVVAIHISLLHNTINEKIILKVD